MDVCKTSLEDINVKENESKEESECINKLQKIITECDKLFKKMYD